ncbi:hypothetical protein MVEN_00609100 [Mycena venus]|uniref:F-box domain-containing protein n=1 Tax=Mycena venus TaxID=2733690 RepID=A0A8H6YMD1_9AGAR|nr:hypothetical protein MVEN_00609100 [Mycena venus]
MCQESASASSLLDLPNELLLAIAGRLDDDSLLHLAASCKRMNLLLIPGIFARCDYKLPHAFFGALPAQHFNGESLVVLPAIGIASFIHSIDEIDCAFFAYNRYVLPKEIFGAATALNTLAIRLKHLGHLKFNPYVAGYSTHELFGWSNAVAAFLNSAAERGDCAITVYSGFRDDYVADPRPFSHVFRAQGSVARSQSRVTIGQRLKRALASLLRFSRRNNDGRRSSQGADAPVFISTPGIESTERPSGVKIPFVGKSGLTTLSIESSFLFHANFYRWTLHTINTSPLTSLTLSNIDLSHYDWTLTLPALTIPALTHLTIGPGQCAITVPDLDAFLARHPTIWALDLSFHPAIGALTPPTTVQMLPRLASLFATPDYLLYFLSGEEAGAWYPALRAVGVTSNDESVYQVAQFARVVDVVGARNVVPCVSVSGRLANHCEVPAHLSFSVWISQGSA